MMSFFLPIIYMLGRQAARNLISSLIDGFKQKIIHNAVAEASVTVKSKIAQLIKDIFYKYIFNITIFLLAVFLLPKYLDTQMAILGICTVYAGSVIDVMFSFFKNIGTIATFSVNTLRHGVSQSVYITVYNIVSPEVDKEYDNKPFYVKPLIWLRIGPQPNEMKHEISLAARRIVFNYSFLIFTIFSSYIIVFRLYVSPLLIKSTTHLNTMQAFVYPFAYSVDLFLKTETLKYFV